MIREEEDELHPHARPRHQAVRGGGGASAQERQQRSSAARTRSTCTTPTASSSTSPSRWRARTGMTVDRAGYERRMEELKEDPGKGRKKIVITAVTGRTAEDRRFAQVQRPRRPRPRSSAGSRTTPSCNRRQLEQDDEAALLLDRTNFYAEQGGQVGDTGTITTADRHASRSRTRRGSATRCCTSAGSSRARSKSGQPATLEVGGDRADTMRNHTATHLLNWALRKVLGEHIEQKGSLVDADKTRFDFTHDKPLTAEEIAEVERLVNEKIYADLPVTPVTMPLAEAKKIAGVRAVFGEKYPDPVRVLLIGAEKPEEATPEHSVEFCGGTHLKHTGQAGFFKIVSQEAVGKGVRRVTAVTGREAVATVQRLAACVDELTGRLQLQAGGICRRASRRCRTRSRSCSSSSRRARPATWPARPTSCCAAATEVERRQDHRRRDAGGADRADAPAGRPAAPEGRERRDRRRLGRRGQGRPAQLGDRRPGQEGAARRQAGRRGGEGGRRRGRRPPTAWPRPAARTPTSSARRCNWRGSWRSRG